jgi:carboxymethylenebutenolidase
MCHNASDRPFIRQVGGAAPEAGDLILRSGDGTRFDAFFAKVDSRPAAGVVILPDAGGLSQFYRDLAERFAGEGICSVALDYYGRTAGLGPRPATFNGDEHMAKTTPETVDADVAAAAAYLGSSNGGAVGSVISVGFCFGGAVSWRQAARGLAGGIGFYGSGAALRETVPDLTSLHAPLLLLVAEADPYFPIEDSRQIDRELEAAAVVHETVIYPNAPHGFFSSGSWAEACEDSWRRALKFVRAAGATQPKN